MQGGKAANAKQKVWQEWQRARDCCNCGAPASIHHAVGSTAKHNKQHIGQFFTLALCYDCHQGDHGIHHDLTAFTEDPDWSRKEIEKHYFSIDVMEYFSEFGAITMPLEVYKAIMSYHK